MLITYEVREEIFRMLTAVPEDFNDLRDYLFVYSELSDVDFSTCAASVCTQILCTLQQAMRFMSEDPFKNVIESIKMEIYEQTTSTCIEQLQNSEKRFRIAVDKHLHNRVGNLFRLAKSSSMLQKMIFWEVAQTKKETFGVIEANQRDLKEELAQFRNAVLNSLYNKLLSDEYEREYISQLAATKVLNMQKPGSGEIQNGLPVSQIKLADFDMKNTQVDLLHGLSVGNKLSSADVGRMVSIKSNKSFRDWIFTSKSTALFIGGNGDLGLADYTSMTSFLCAEVAHLSEPIEETMVLTYFCGARAAPTCTAGGRAGAKDMMLSLLGQLLANGDETALQQAVIDENLGKKVVSGRLSALCDAFGSIVQQVSSSWTILCFVDAIEFYETQDRCAKTLRAIESLASLVKECKKGKGPAFKLLVTSAKLSLVVSREFSSKNQIICSEDPVEESALPASIIASDIFEQAY